MKKLEKKDLEKAAGGGSVYDDSYIKQVYEDSIIKHGGILKQATDICDHFIEKHKTGEPPMCSRCLYSIDKRGSIGCFFDYYMAKIYG